MGTEHKQDQQNRGENPPENLLRDDLCDPIKVDLVKTRHEEYERRVQGRVWASLVNPFALTFLRKIKISHTPHRSSKYNYVQETRTGTPEFHAVCRKKSKLATRKHGADYIHDDTGKGFHRWSNFGAQGRKLWWTKIRYDTNDAKLKGLADDPETLDRRFILRAKNTGSWLIVWGTKLTGTVSAATKFCGCLCENYVVTPLSFKKYTMDEISTSLYVTYLAASAEDSPLHIHNKVRDEILYLARKSYPYQCVCREQLIHQGCIISE